VAAAAAIRGKIDLETVASARWLVEMVSNGDRPAQQK
jgi:hypothetical protein